MAKVWQTLRNQAYFKDRVKRMKSEGALFPYQTDIQGRKREG